MIPCKDCITLPICLNKCEIRCKPLVIWLLDGHKKYIRLIINTQPKGESVYGIVKKNIEVIQMNVSDDDHCIEFGQHIKGVYTKWCDSTLKDVLREIEVLNELS
jgi:hypothetical protein